MSRGCSGTLTRLLAALFACMLVGAVGLVGQARAATYTVALNSDATGSCPLTSNKCSLRELINDENALNPAPNPPDTIMVPAGNYDLTNGQLTISQSMNIVGAGAQLTNIYQETTSATSRVFSIQPNPKINANPSVTISGLGMFFGEADSTNGYYGGDVLNEATLTLNEDEIADGETNSGSGAGISNDGGTLTVSHSLVWQNDSTDPNGGGDSGAIQNYGDDTVGAATLNVIDSTIADNEAALGPGIFSWCAGSGGECSSTGANNTATIVNSTIADNTGGNRGITGGGLLASQGTISVENSIVADNTINIPGAPTINSNCGASSPGVITSLGYNIDSGTDCGFDSTGDQSNTNPGFLTGGLAFNGGNTETFALSGTSSAVDAIPPTAPGCSGTDQRDFTRPQGTGCDVGAYELFQPIVGVQTTWVLGQIGAGTAAATVNWGDGTSSAGSVSSAGVVTGTHTYAAVGVYHAEIAYKNSDGASQQTPFDVVVQDAPISATGSHFNAVAGTQFSGTVATFTDENPSATASQFSATINWGDGTRPTAGTVATNPSGGFLVNGTHTYAAAGSYTTTISIADSGGSTASTTGLATVAPPPPTVTQISPSSGPTAGGTTVTITGTNLASATAVKFGNTSATITANTATSITATATAGSAGKVDITVTTAGGTSVTSSADQYTYVARPTVTGINPTAGPTAGGTTVTITGTNLASATAVKFGNTSATITANTATSITATAPAGSGTVDMTVTTIGGTSSTGTPDQYTYTSAPTVTSVSPSAGPLGGGTSVTITGTNLSSATAVEFGSKTAAIKIDAATTITATAPAGTAGSVDVTVTTAGGNSAVSTADKYTYVAAPIVAGVEPTAGPTAGRNPVTISGSNLAGATAVKFGTTPATIDTDTDTSITAIAPAGTAGAIDVTITTPGGASATDPVDQYTYVPVPTVTNVSPASGPIAGGTSVTITGTNLSRATAVEFGTATAPINTNTATSIITTTPAGSAGTVDVTVTTPGGTSPTGAADRYTYNPPAQPSSPPPIQAASSPPVVSGGSPSTETISGASVSGTVNPESLATTTFFQYGLDPSDRGPGASTTLYDQSTPVQTVGADSAIHTVSASLTGLVPGALYHIRLVATNSDGTTFGTDATFTTPQAPAPPAPVLGTTENATPVTGTVFIKSPSGAFVPLTGATQIRTGTEIDALRGSLELVASVGKHKTEHGIFGGAIFRLSQTGRGALKGLTTLTLVESAFHGAPSYALCKAHSAGDPTATAASSRSLQLLHASAHGKFRTSGRYSAATVLGTKWTIADRCDGTLVHDITDSVVVNDFVHHKTIILHAGQSYLAKARK